MIAPAARGQLVCVVGPSGAGKDTLINAVCNARPDIHRARRVITRPASLGGEDFEGVSQEDFEARRRSGAFLFHWQAHAMSYGISTAERTYLNAGRTVIFNGSRAALPGILAKYPDLCVVLVSARPDTLAHRLSARGRESETEIRDRLSRGQFALPGGIAHQVVQNDGTVEEAVSQMLAALSQIHDMTSLKQSKLPEGMP